MVVVAQVKADSLSYRNARAFKAGGEEEVGKRRKEEQVRTESKRGKAGIEPIRG